MFVLTLNKKTIQRSALMVCALAVITVSAFMVGGYLNNRAQTTAGATQIKVQNTGDMVNYLLGFGLEVDVTTARLENGKVPKKFDDSFTAFNEVIQQGGGDLSRYKNKKIEKWSFVVPALSTNGETANAVLIIYKNKVIGSYVLMQPSGEVLPITVQANTFIQLEETLEAANE